MKDYRRQIQKAIEVFGKKWGTIVWKQGKFGLSYGGFIYHKPTLEEVTAAIEKIYNNDYVTRRSERAVNVFASCVNMKVYSDGDYGESFKRDVLSVLNADSAILVKAAG